MSNTGDEESWAGIARKVYGLSGQPEESVSGVSTAEYFKDKDAAPRPLNSVLVLDKLEAAGFRPPAADERLAAYVMGCE